jgi:hypothetical protein
MLRSKHLSFWMVAKSVDLLWQSVGGASLEETTQQTQLIMLYEVLAGRLDYLRYAPARAEASPTPTTKRRLKWMIRKSQNTRFYIMPSIIEEIGQKLPQAPESVLKEVLLLLNSATRHNESSEVIPSLKRRRVAPPSIAGKGQTLGDIVSPIVDEQDWECLK